MSNRLSANRPFLAMLAVATVAHFLLLLVPVVRQQVKAPAEAPVVSVRLMPSPPAAPPVEERADPVPREPLQRTQRPPIELADLPPDEPAPVDTPPATPTVIDARRILSDMERRREADPLASLDSKPPGDRPDFQVRYRPVLDEVLNEPSLQLPFRDTRVYLVDSYDPGLMGGVQRFFDEVTVPFGFTTRHNTRIQCAWILVIAGCSWGHASHYYARDRARKRPPENP